MHKGMRCVRSYLSASIPASIISCGVSKSGSPAANDTTSTPLSRRELARSDSNMVLEGRTAATHGFKAVSKPVPLLEGCAAHLVCMAARWKITQIRGPLLAESAKDLEVTRWIPSNTSGPMGFPLHKVGASSSALTISK